MSNCNAETSGGPARRRPAALLLPLLLQLLTLLFCLALAMPGMAAPVLALGQHPENIDLTPHLDIIDNPGHTLAIHDILSPAHINSFAPFTQTSGGTLEGFSNTFWLRFSISNNSSEPVTYWLRHNHNAIRTFSLYRLQPGGRHEPVGDTRISGNSHPPLLQMLVINAHSSATFMVDVETAGKETPNLELIRPDILLPATISEAMKFAFGLGILALTVLLNLLIALYRRSWIFLCNGGFILAITAAHGISLDMPHPLLVVMGDSQPVAMATFFYLGAITSLLCIQAYIKATHSNYRHLRKLKSATYASAAMGLPAILLCSTWPLLAVAPLFMIMPFVMAALIDCYTRYGDRIALSISLVTTVSAALFILLLLFRGPGFTLDMLADPWVLFLLVFHTTTVTALFVTHEYLTLQNELDQKLVMATYAARHKAQNDLLQEFSRDMQAPLSGILGMADLLKSSSLTAEQHARVDAIKSSGQTLLNEIAGIHYRIQLEQNSENIRQTPFELGLLLENCINSFGQKAENRNVELILQIQPDIPAVVKGDEYRLRQIIFQLLENAVNNTEQGQVVLKVSRNATDHNIIYFNIQDTGRGIPEDKIPKKDGKPNSTGLTAVTKLLRQMKSELLIDSIEGEGSTFSFLLELPAVASRHDRETSLDEILHYKRLLIVDDNHTSCKVLKQLGNSWGMQVAEAHNGNEAVGMYRAKHNLGETFDAVIVDYDMPQVSGIDVAAKITREAGENQPVIIMLAGLSKSPPEHIAKQAGVDVVLSKPASQKLLKLTLCNLFRMKQKNTTALPSKPAGKFRILVADDNDVIRSVISKMMETMNVDYKMVADGKMAVDAAKKEPFDIILMDCEMPFMDGFEATRQIHRWQQERHQPLTPVIALTAYTLGEHKQQSIAAGMADFLEKPINMAELEAVLQRYQTGKDNPC